MPRTATPQRPTDPRSHILDTAQRLIAANGFAGVGLNEILSSAGVPKGSFYHWFSSKESFGADLLNHYFAKYMAELEDMLGPQQLPPRQRLEAYWRFWRENQVGDDPDGRCLAVKLGAEVSDISEDMRLALQAGTSSIIARLARVVEEGLKDGSIASGQTAEELAETLYQLWLGASIMSKITRGPGAFDAALVATDRLLSGSR